MAKFYVTFGQSHTHRINGKTVDCDTALEVEAPSEYEAREKVFDAIGKVWAFMYAEGELDIARWCPKGIVQLEQNYDTI